MQIHYTHKLLSRKKGTLYVQFDKGFVGYYVPEAETSAAHFNLNLEVAKILTPRYGGTINFDELYSEWSRLYPTKAAGKDPASELSRRIAYLENLGFLKSRSKVRSGPKVWDVCVVDMRQYAVEGEGYAVKTIKTLAEERKERKGCKTEGATPIEPSLGKADAVARCGIGAIQAKLAENVEARKRLDEQDAILRQALAILGVS